jgi:hypothetical protein
LPFPLALTNTPSIGPSASELTRPASATGAGFWAGAASTFPTFMTNANKANFIRIFHPRLFGPCSRQQFQSKSCGIFPSFGFEAALYPHDSGIAQAIRSSVTDPLPSLHIFLACRPVFGIVVALLVHFQMGSARQRPRTLPATSTFPLFRGDIRARSDPN